MATPCRERDLAGDFDGRLLRGEYSGDFTEDANASFTVAWTQNESRFTGTDISAYQARNGGSQGG